ncbi:hypothetical protein E8E13_004890 [Curvularia kusanoi]|uniref:Uncharacterized protein n=1 Tax=Curvularia kusanoi TaxID=90978 RepID=A0A9P4TG19_CURKU|nr:hypothetical protein E8E13_004890 [Curvularia kusanoi]
MADEYDPEHIHHEQTSEDTKQDLREGEDNAPHSRDGQVKIDKWDGHHAVGSVETDLDADLDSLPSSPPAFEPSVLNTNKMKVKTDGEGDVSPSLITIWRDPLRQRDRLNTSLDRIETDFLLESNFIDDINAMLDTICGWNEYEISGVRQAFEMDPQNRNRSVVFTNLGGKEWKVRLLSRIRRDSGTSYELPGFYSHEDLPDICLKHGCDAGCPRKVSFQELAADLRRFRKGKMKVDHAEKLDKTKQFVRPAVPFQRATQAPPVSSHSNKGKPSDGSPKIPNSGACPPSPRPGNLALPDDLTMAKPGLFPDGVRSQIERVKKAIRDRSVSLHVSGREAVRSWLQEANVSSKSRDIVRTSGLLEAISRDHRFTRSAENMSVKGKLAHKEKIPSGATSIRAEKFRLISHSDWQSTTLHSKRLSAPDRSRAEFFAARVQPSPESDGTACGMEETLTTPNAPGRKVPRVKFIPQYEKHPEAY